MNSFDVFDTLVGRRYITIDPILQAMERESGIVNFAEARKLVDTGGRSFDQIYDALVSQGVLSQQQRKRMQRLEITLELLNAIPIQRNLDRVNHGDLLISDTYLPSSVIFQLVCKVGLEKQVTIYQSNGDKACGVVWQKLKTKPDLHLGDNRHSDVNQPMKAGIKAEWFNRATQMNNVEHTLMSASLAHIAFLCREIRLRVNLGGIPAKFFIWACALNLPLLFALAELVHRTVGNRNLVFLGRDCQLLHRLYTAYYRSALYLPFSRQVAYNQPADAIAYLRMQSPQNPVFIDMSSTGATWAFLQNNIEILVAIYSDLSGASRAKTIISPTFKFLMRNSQIGATNLLLEIANCGNHGRLDHIEIHEGQFMQAFYGEPELSDDIIHAVHLPVKQAVDLAGIYRQDVRRELNRMPNKALVDQFARFADRLCSRADLLNRMKEFKRSEHYYQFQTFRWAHKAAEPIPHY
jgi:hypothetical protein